MKMAFEASSLKESINIILSHVDPCDKNGAEKREHWHFNILLMIYQNKKDQACCSGTCHMTAPGKHRGKCSCISVSSSPAWVNSMFQASQGCIVRACLLKIPSLISCPRQTCTLQMVMMQTENEVDNYWLTRVRRQKHADPEVQILVPRIPCFLVCHGLK